MTLYHHKAACALALVLAAALPACKPADAPGPQAAAPSATEGTAPQPAAADAQASPPPTPAAQGTAMDKTCGGVTFRIARQQAPESGEAGPQEAGPQTVLQRIGSDGAATTIDKPAEMSDYTAVALGCADAANDGKSYLVVQYGELPYGCNFCEWFYLYDADGKQLTKSDPPILVDETLPTGRQQTSNTKEYEALIQKLGIQHPEVDYIE